MEAEGKHRPVYVDFKTLSETRELALGRPLTKEEREILDEADAIRIDSLACRRSVATTVRNIEENGGKVSSAVKSVLGLIPPTN